MTYKPQNKNHREENKLQNLPDIGEKTELLEYLRKCFPEKSRNSIKSLLTHKQVLVNGIASSKYNHTIKPGDKVSLLKGKAMQTNDLAGIKIIFEDDSLIVIEKASGLLSVSTEGEKERTAYHMLSSYVKSRGGRHIFVLHRLDRETSGVMMFAKSQEVQILFQNNWREMVLERHYTVIVEGKVEKNEGTINSNLIESRAMKVHSTNKPQQGQPATTFYKLLKQLKEYAILEVSLETGRKNQIRVHMHEMGNPVAGDKKYGAKTNPLQRLGLHASLLVFRHPVTREVLRFESPLPASFRKLRDSENFSPK